MKKIKIKNNLIQNNLKCFVIAEIGLSHDGSFGIAKNLIDRAKKVAQMLLNSKCI